MTGIDAIEFVLYLDHFPLIVQTLQVLNAAKDILHEIGFDL